MYTSAKKFNKISIHYFLGGMFVTVFVVIYEYFSHGVISNYMIFAPVLPLVLGCMLTLVLKMLNVKAPYGFTRVAYAWGIVTTTLGLIMKGVFEIYGSTNDLTNYYFIFGPALMVLGALAYAITPNLKKNID